MKHIQLFRPYYRVGEVTKELNRVFRSGWTGLGPETKIFETELAEYFGVKYAVMTNSATAALHLAVKLLDLPKGSEVITTAMTFVSTNHVLLYEGLKPVFCDINPETGCIDETKIESLITENVKAIMVVHYAGMPADMDVINDIGRAYNIPIIEDCCHAFGSTLNGEKIGNSNNICAFSFHSVKACPICDGGAITTNNKLYYDRLQKLIWLGIDKSTYSRVGTEYHWHYNVDEIGYKYHGNDVLAAIGRVSLRYVDADIKRRREIVRMYREGLGDLVTFVPSKRNYNSAYHICAIWVPDEGAIVQRLRNQGIDIGCHYTPNIYYDMYKSCRGANNIPFTEHIYGGLMSLPLHLKLTNADVRYVIKAVKNVLK